MDEVETTEKAEAKSPEMAETIEKTVYELSYHLLPSLGGDDLAAEVDALRKGIEDNGGVIFNEVYPEHFELVYTMTKRISGKLQKFATSHMGWIHFETEADKIDSIKQAIDKDDSVIRHLIVKTTKEQALAQPMSAQKKEEEAVAPALAPAAPAPKVEKPEEKEEISEEEVDKAIEELVV